MNTINKQYSKVNITDSSKGHKIVAALYLVTNHLSDSEPIRVAIRARSIELLASSAEQQQKIGVLLIDLLNAAQLAGIVSEKNTSIIALEIRHFTTAHVEQIRARLEEVLISPEVAPFNQTKTHHQIRPLESYKTSSYVQPTKKEYVFKENAISKNERQEKILSFINDRKSAAIKDISSLFPGLSEKTVQRELGALVAGGKVTKRGSKRWSVYMAI